MYRIKQFFEDCPMIFISIIASIFTVIGGVIDYNLQQANAGNIPLIFSEISQIQRNYAAQGLSTPAVTMYYGATNDTAMKVFEANNLAYKQGGSHKAFAQELEFKVDPALKVHHLISEYAKEMPGISSEAIKAIAPLPQMSKELYAICKNLNAAWDEDHHDVYHTEYYTVTDSKGNSHTESRQVYDYTIHTYTYYPSYAQVAATQLQKFTVNYPTLLIENVAPKIINTGAENESAISGKGKMVDSDKAKAIVIKNYHDSAIYQNRPKIYKDHKALVRVYTDKYNRSLASAMSCQYHTYSHSDPGPKSFQIRDATLQVSATLQANIDGVVTPITQSSARTQQLYSDITKYIGIVLDRRDGNAGDLRDSIMNTAKVMYKENFISGVDVETFSTGEFILVLVLSLIMGCIVSVLILRFIILQEPIFI